MSGFERFYLTSLELDIVHDGHCSLSNPGVTPRPFLIILHMLMLYLAHPSHRETIVYRIATQTLNPGTEAQAPSAGR